MTTILPCVHKGHDGRPCVKPGYGFQGYCIKHQNFKRLDDANYALHYDNESYGERRGRYQRWIHMKRHNADIGREERAGYFFEAVNSHAEEFGALLRGAAMMAHPFDNTALPLEVRRVTDNLESVAFHLASYSSLATPDDDPMSLAHCLWKSNAYPQGLLTKRYVKQFIKACLNCVRSALKKRRSYRVWWLRLLTLIRRVQDVLGFWADEEDTIVAWAPEEGDEGDEGGDGIPDLFVPSPNLPPHPEGGIHLGAFLADSQNVHTAPAKMSTEYALAILMKRPLPHRDIGTSIEHHFRNTPKEIGFTLDQRNKIVAELAHDGLRVTAFGYHYADAFVRVWDKVLAIDSADVLRRLAEELYEGIGMCCQGKMTRLINALRGFDEELDEVSLVSQGELLQMAMARIAVLALSERGAAVAAAFAEYGVPEAEQEDWRSAVMEA